MGLFLDRLNELDKKAENRGQFGSLTIGSNQNQPTAAKTVTAGVNSIIDIVRNAEGSDDKQSNGVNPETKQKIDEKEKELTAVYSEAGVSSYSALNNLLDTQKSDVSRIQGELSKIGSSKSIQAKIDGYTEQLKLAKANNEDTGEYEQAIKDLQLKLQEAQAKEEELKNAQIEQVRLESLVGKADNIKLEINQLNGEATGVSYDVEKETQDIKNFMTALNEFKSSPSQETAKKLKSIYEKGAESGGDNGIDNNSIQKAWELIKDMVQNYADGKVKPKNAA